MYYLQLLREWLVINYILTHNIYNDSLVKTVESIVPQVSSNFFLYFKNFVKIKLALVTFRSKNYTMPMPCVTIKININTLTRFWVKIGPTNKHRFQIGVVYGDCKCHRSLFYLKKKNNKDFDLSYEKGKTWSMKVKTSLFGRRGSSNQWSLTTKARPARSVNRRLRADTEPTFKVSCRDPSRVEWGHNFVFRSRCRIAGKRL